MERSASILPLELDAVGYRVRDQQLVDGVTTRLEAGARSVILGPNGAGKSLTLRMAHGLITPTSGRVRWCGPASADARARQAMVFDHAVLLRRGTAANVAYALALQGVRRADRKARIDAVLERTGLLALASRPARVLSAGERQRLSIARAWVLRPEVLFLDEPTGSLDPAATRQVEELIREISADGAKIVMTTHDLGQARRLGDEVLFMHQGRLVEQGPAEPFFESPQTEVARAFLEGELIA